MATVTRRRSWVRVATSPVRRLGAWFAEAVVGVVRRGMRDDITGIASQFAYNAFLATVPFLFVLVSLVGLVAAPDAFDEFLSDDADNAIPVELRGVLRTSMSQATANTGQAALFLVVGLVGAIYVSANVMGALVGGLDRARGVPHRPWARGKLVATFFVMATSLLVVATTLALVGGSQLVEGVAEEIFGKGAPNVAGDLLYLIGAGSLLTFTVAMYHYGPNAPRRRVIGTLPGALIAVALWLGASRAFAFYVQGFDSLQNVYGALAGAAVYLIFLFLTCVALLIGAEVNEQLYAMRRARREGRSTEPIGPSRV